MVSVVCLITLGDLIVFPRHHGVVKTDRYGHMIEVDDNKDYRLDQLIFEERKTEVSNRGTDIDKNIPLPVHFRWCFATLWRHRELHGVQYSLDVLLIAIAKWAALSFRFDFEKNYGHDIWRLRSLLWLEIEKLFIIN